MKKWKFWNVQIVDCTDCATEMNKNNEITYYFYSAIQSFFLFMQ